MSNNPQVDAFVAAHESLERVVNTTDIDVSTDVCSIGTTTTYDEIPYNRLHLSGVTNSNALSGGPGKQTTTEMVRKTMVAYEQALPTKPTWPSARDYRLRVRLDVEETMEKFHLGYYNADAVQILDGSCDADVVITGADLTFGFDHDGAVTEVNRSNMTKLDPITGKPNKDAGGKVIKPDTYSPANLLPFVGDLATTKPEYDTQSIVREEFTKTLAKRIALVDFPLLVREMTAIMNAAEKPVITPQRAALKTMFFLPEIIDYLPMLTTDKPE